MRKTGIARYGLPLWIWILCTACTQEAPRTARDAVEKTKPLGAVKITCVERGMHRILGDQLAKLGIPLEDIDVTRMALVHQNESIPFYFLNSGNEYMDPADALYFFAQGVKSEEEPYLNIRKDYYPASQSFMLHLARSSYRPVRFKKKAVRVLRVVDDPERFPLCVVEGREHFERDSIWEFVQEADEQDAGDETDPATDSLFWKKLSFPHSGQTSSRLTLPFVLPELVPDTEGRIRIRLVGVSDVGGIRQTLKHKVTVDVNGQHSRDFEWNRPQKYTAELKIPAGALKSGENSLTFKLNPPGRTAGSGSGAKRKLKLEVVVLDWFDVEFKQYAKVHEGYSEFLINEDGGQELPLTIRNFQGTEPYVFDLAANEVFTDWSFKEMNAETYGVDLRVERGKKTIVAFDKQSVRTPSRLERTFPRGLFQQPVDCDMLILTHAKFRKILRPFIEWKQKRGLKAHMVDIGDIYNERTAGYATCQALRDYVEYVYSSQPEPMLKYLLLVGDSNLVAKYKSYLPAYSYHHSGKPADDNFYANFEDVGKPPVVAVGRFSVTTSEQLQNIIQKVIVYESGENRDHWRSQFLVIAASESWANKDADVMIKHFAHPNYRVNLIKTESDRASTQYHRELTDNIIDQFNAGNLITTFFGHGGGTVWEVGPAMNGEFFRAHLFDQGHVESLENLDRPSLVFALTCYTNKFDDPHVAQTLGEIFMNSAGGAIAVIGASQRSHSSLNSLFLQAIMRTLRENRFDRLGDHFMSAKRALRTANANTYILLGDPSLEFHLPRNELVLSDAIIDVQDRVIKLDYELPADVACPVELKISLLDQDEKLVAEWTQSVEEPKGKLKFDIENEGADRNLRVVGYVAGDGNQTYSGGTLIEKATSLTAM